MAMGQREEGAISILSVARTAACGCAADILDFWRMAERQGNAYLPQLHHHRSARWNFGPNLTSATNWPRWCPLARPGCHERIRALKPVGRALMPNTGETPATRSRSAERAHHPGLQSRSVRCCDS